ncbi:MAG: hypothetical protein ACK58L_08700 [Planctomycetota bacterium]
MTTHIIFQCPSCQRRMLTVPDPSESKVGCNHCHWTRDEGTNDFQGGHLVRCRICGCEDLWRQKDFPPGLGLIMAGTAAMLSIIAWAMYMPVLALAILMGAGLIDMILYSRMGDMLVCYRCKARHRKTAMQDEHPTFDLETEERYRQQRLRQTGSG